MPSSKSRCVDRARDGRPRHRRTSQPQELGFVYIWEFQNMWGPHLEPRVI